MIKLIIFDLDGVLVNTKNIHFEALNQSLEKIHQKYAISYKDHLKFYDGLSTYQKLNLITKKKNLPKKYHEKIWQNKKNITRNIIKKIIKKDLNVYTIIKNLSQKYKIAVATNAIRDTLNDCLEILGINQYINFSISNEDVEFAKPNPQIYLKCMTHFGVSPDGTLILEDSPIGRKSAVASKAKLLPIEKLGDVTLNNIISHININKNNKLLSNSDKWASDKLNILVPMAGAGKRFLQAGYTFPKPLIEIDNTTMIEIVVNNLSIDANYIFIVKKEHLEKYNLRTVLKLINKKSSIISVDQITEGAACTTLLAEKFINNNKQLIIANSDQFIEWNPIESMYKFTSNNVDGGILTFKSKHPKWSYAKINKQGYVQKVAEKNPISNHATVGVYYWKKGSDYVKYSKKMIKKNIRTNNEFYVCPVYNEAIKDKKNITTFQVKKMWGLGTPEDLRNFQNFYFQNKN